MESTAALLIESAESRPMRRPSPARASWPGAWVTAERPCARSPCRSTLVLTHALLVELDAEDVLAGPHLLLGGDELLRRDADEIVDANGERIASFALQFVPMGLTSQEELDSGTHRHDGEKVLEVHWYEQSP